MAQRINLLSALPERYKPYLSNSVIKWVVFLWILILAILYGGVFWMTSNKQRKLNRLTTTRSHLIKQLKIFQNDINRAKELIASKVNKKPSLLKTNLFKNEIFIIIF